MASLFPLSRKVNQRLILSDETRTLKHGPLEQGLMTLTGHFRNYSEVTTSSSMRTLLGSKKFQDSCQKTLSGGSSERERKRSPNSMNSTLTSAFGGSSSIEKPLSGVSTSSTAGLTSSCSSRSKILQNEPVANFVDNSDTVCRHIVQIYLKTPFYCSPKANPKRNLDLTFGHLNGSYLVGNSDDSLRFIRKAYLLKEKVKRLLLFFSSRGVKPLGKNKKFLVSALCALKPDAPSPWYNNLQIRLRRMCRRTRKSEES